MRFHCFDRFLADCDNRFEKDYWFLRPVIKQVLERLSLDEREGKVCYQYGKEHNELERMVYLDLTAWTTSYISDKGQVTGRYYTASTLTPRGGKVKKASLEAFPLRMVEEELRPPLAKG